MARLPKGEKLTDYCQISARISPEAHRIAYAGISGSGGRTITRALLYLEAHGPSNREGNFARVRMLERNILSLQDVLTGMGNELSTLKAEQGQKSLSDFTDDLTRFEGK